MAQKVQIVVEAKDAASGILRGITSQFGAFGTTIEQLTGKNINWGDAAAAAADLVVDQVKQAIKVTQEYASEVRDLALASGTSAEEASRLLQVLDDFEISAGDVTTATRIMTKNGLAPTVETIAELADRYVTLNTAQEKNAFVIENLGRGGMKWANALNQGGDAIRALNKDVNENLILTDEQIQKTEEYRLAVDNWNDTMMGLQVSVGIEALTKLTDAMAILSEYFQRNDSEIEQNQNKWATWAGVIFPALRGFETLMDVIGASKDVMNKSETAVSSLSIKEQDLALATATAAAAAENSVPQFAAQLSMMEKLNNATREQIKMVAYQDLKAKLSEGGIDEAEAKLLEDAGIALGVFDENAASAARSIETLNTALASGNIELWKYVDGLSKIPSEITTTVTTEYADYSSNSQPGHINEAAGGSVYAQQPYIVGEAGAEPFIPSQNGRILGHAETLHQMGMAGGAGTNYFYGNVTLAIDEGTAGGLLGYR